MSDPVAPVGDKETKDVLLAGLAIAKFVVQRAKDGIGIDDAEALVAKIMTDTEFKQVLTDAVTNIQQVPAELKDLDTGEILDLLFTAAKGGLEIVGAKA
jgi:hypothetical protein